MTPERLIELARQRIRRLRATTTILTWGWLAFAIGALVVLSGRWLPWAATEVFGFTLAVVLFVGGIVWAFTRPVSDLEVARATDAGLASHDALSAYLEFAEPRNELQAPLVDRISQRAKQVAQNADLKKALPLRRPSRWRLAGLAVMPVVMFGALWAPNPQDARREHAQQVASAKDRVVKELKEQLKELDPKSEAAQKLSALIDRIEAATPEEALGLLAAAEAELALKAGNNLESARAATAGLDASVEARPLPGSNGGDAATQLDAAANSVDSMSAEERSELAERLEALASTQTAGAPEVADALSKAAEAVESGSGAAQALSAAAAAQRAQQSSVGERGEAAAAASAAGAARSSLSESMSGSGSGSSSKAGEGSKPGSQSAQGSQQGKGSGKGQGQGQGEGQGQGQGSGQGPGQGQGSGAGQGQGQGGGNPSGTIGGGPRTGGGSGQGGAGQPGSGNGAARPGLEGPSGTGESVFAPDPKGKVTGEGPMTGSGGDLGETVGKGDTSTQVGTSRTSMSEAIRRYADNAARASNQPGLPSVQRSLINDYFARLSGAS